MARRKMEDILADLRNEGLDDYAEELEPYTGSALRKRAEDAEGVIRERDDLKARLAKVEKAPRIETALGEAGVDVTGLSKLERQAIAAADLDPDDADALAKFIEENELPTTKASGEAGEGGEGEGEESTPEAAKVAAAATRNPGPGGRVTLKPEDTAEWSTERLMKFREAHPEEFEELKKGNEVTVPA
jgi:hypothetical protein